MTDFTDVSLKPFILCNDIANDKAMLIMFCDNAIEC